MKSMQSKMNARSFVIQIINANGKIFLNEDTENYKMLIPSTSEKALEMCVVFDFRKLH